MRILKAPKVNLAEVTLLSAVIAGEERIDIDVYANIRNIASIYTRLREALVMHRAVVVSVPDGAEADLSFVQLIETARRDAAAAGKVLQLARPAQGSLLRTLTGSGILAALDGEGLKFWLHNEVMP